MAERERAARLSVIVAGRAVPDAFEETLAALASQPPDLLLEVLLADGSASGQMASVARRRLPQAQHLPLPGANLPALKGAAIRRAGGELVAIIDPGDAPAANWAMELGLAFEDPTVTAAGGVVELAGPRSPGNVAAYLFEYGAFNPPLAAGDTAGDLPGNNVAYRRAALLETCADILEAEGFNKPFFHERLRQRGGRLVIWPGMKVRHLSDHRLRAFGPRRFHYGRCFGAVRVRRAAPAQKAMYRMGAPLVAPLLISRHLLRAASHQENRRLLPGAALALCAVCACWGVGEWLGYWFGAGRSCRELY